MNLELIRKYEKEFLHMLHGGKILVKYIDKENAPDKDYLDWHSDNDVFESNLDYLIVIDDEYLPFRKALAEGKTVQYRTKYSNWVDYKDNNGINCNIFSSNKSVDICYEYRIKPEEPKFKVGDWVTVNGPTGTFTECISRINYNTYTLSGTNICFKSQATKWEPKKGEICVFWEEDSEYNRAIIGKLKQIISNGNYIMDYGSGYTVTYSNCMPFTGIIPPHMKD